MNYHDPRAKRFRELVDRLMTESREVDSKFDRIYAEARMRGLLSYYLPMLYYSLHDDDMFIKTLPEAIENLLDEINQDVVMKKLES